ncbi:gamma-glutamyltransferase [Serratia ureilytica]
MDDFSAKPGVANAFGAVGSDANAIEPGKRMLSSMSPTIITRDGEVSLVIGTPGGSRIFTSIFEDQQPYDYHLPLAQAVAAQRVHHQLLPKDTLCDSFAPLTGKPADELKAMGYTLEDQGWNMGDIRRLSASMAARRKPRPIRAAAASAWW